MPDPIENLELPYLTADLPGIGGQIKGRAEDFRVEEIPLVRPSGKGRHAFFKVEKIGITTRTAVERVARWMGVHPGLIGFAGMKDSLAVCMQWMSLERADERRLRAFRNRNVRVVDVAWHGQKLMIGQLLGNRFRVRVRGVGKAEFPKAQAILDVLDRRGVPNYFGQQRFGLRGDNDLLGETLIRGRWDLFIQLFLGRPQDGDAPEFRTARHAFDQGDFQRAMRAWPRQCTDPRKALSAFMKRHKPKDAVAVVDKRLRRLFLSAFQSRLFNDVLAVRIQSIDKVLGGDVLEDHQQRRLVPAVEVSDAIRRVAEFAFSPTGLLPGYDSVISPEAAGQIEQAALTRRGIDLAMFANYRPLDIRGARRPLRFPLRECRVHAGADGDGKYIELEFIAPPGCYATVLLDEVMKKKVKSPLPDAH